MKILIEMEQNDKITKKELKNAIIDILKCYDVKENVKIIIKEDE